MQPLLVVFAIYSSRARFVILDILGQDCAAALATDRYASYARIDVEHRQICWADLLRDLNLSGQRHGLPGQIGRRLLGLGLVMVRWRERGLRAGARLEGLQRSTQATLLRGSQQLHCTRTANTCNNILKLWPALWPFTFNPLVAPANSAAEQDLRSIVLRRKIFGPSRSRRGDQFRAHVSSVHGSGLRQGRDLWGFAHAAVQAFIANSAPPRA